jgi:parallel beta helix pectate lyase-like protein
MNTKNLRLTGMAVLLLTGIVGSAFGTVIQVPADQPTIQGAINAARSGDTVLVSSGTYTENINFLGKAVKVKSSTGPKLTIINGNQAGPVVTFTSGETKKSILSGFTITNGLGNQASGYSGGGIYCNNSSPTIQHNTITANTAGVGGGIEVYGGSPFILSNNISDNIQDPNLDGGWGGGISLENGSSATIIGNHISGNLWSGNSNCNCGQGGGIALNSAGSPLLENNEIFSNAADYGPGGGIWIIDTSAWLIQNLIYNNTAQFGGGVYIDLSSTSYQAIFVNNTFAGNVGNGQGLPGDGSAVYAVGYDNYLEFFNNIFASSAGRESFFCAPAGALPAMTANDGFSSSGNGFGGDCAGLAGTNGNISADPQFVKPTRNNYQLKSTSPVINAGDLSAPDLPTKDLRGKPRIVDGGLDMGVYEFQ